MQERSLKIEQERRRERPKPIRTRQGSGDHSAYLMVCTRMFVMRLLKCLCLYVCTCVYVCLCVYVCMCVRVCVFARCTT